MIKEVLETKTFGEDLKSRINRIFRPIQSCGGTNWKEKGLPKDDDSEAEDAKDVKSPEKTPVTQGDRILLSPNVLSLFLEKQAFPKMSASAPPVNHRPLRIKRVWLKDAVGTDDNPGMIGSLLGVAKDQTHDVSFRHLDYLIFPYKATEQYSASMALCSVANPTSPAAASEFIFAHKKDMDTNHYSKHVTREDVRGLLKILCKVC